MASTDRAPDLWPRWVRANPTGCTGGSGRRKDPPGADSPQNHWWGDALSSAGGLTTSMIASGIWPSRSTSDFVNHDLVIVTSRVGRSAIPLRRCRSPCYRRVLASLAQVAACPTRASCRVPVEVAISSHSSRISDVRPYDREKVATDPTARDEARSRLRPLPCRFLAKRVPLQFFWGGFDLASARFYGPRAARRTRVAASPNVHIHVMHERIHTS